MTPALELEAVCYGVMTATTDDRDRIVHALNERFSELGRNHPVPYSEDEGDH
jgi:RNA binding exosome subunit